jgi:uncharacterized protein Gcw-chp
VQDAVEFPGPLDVIRGAFLFPRVTTSSSGETMKRANVLGAALVVASAVATATPAAAQATIGADLGVFSDYVWRGITYTNKLVFQPDVYLTFPTGPASFTAGGWFNIEPGKYDGATDISEGGGLASPDLAEFDWWGEFNYPYQKANFTLGATGYIFPNDGGFTKAANTVELYGKVGLSVPLNPKVAMWYDVDKIKGAYFEGSISHTIKPKDQPFSVVLGALAGLNEGQGIPTDPNSTESFNFVDNGFTHLDLSAAVPFTAGPLSISPAVHVVVTGDDATKFTKIDATTGLPNKKDVKVWFGGTISWSKALGEAPAEEGGESTE